MVTYKQAEQVAVADLRPYEKNAKVHNEKQIKNIAKSIEKFGFTQPLVIDDAGVVIIGHGRLEAAKLLGLETVPCIRRDDLTEKQIKELRIIDNKLNESPWDQYILGVELESVELNGYDFSEDYDKNGSDFFENRKRDDTSRQDGNNEYNQFLDKFEIAKTTDDCYTPDVVYDAVANYVEERFGVKRENFVRPFYPGGDYEKEKYKATDVVVDNPPFSILAQIARFYGERGIRYFLFAPGVSAFSGDDGKRCAICLNVPVIYENGANVSTSFVTNMIDEYVAVTDPELYRRVDEAAKEYAKQFHKELPQYEFPDNVITASKLGYISKYGQELKIRRAEAVRITELDAMKESGKGIYGGAFLVSQRAAAEKAAAEKAAAEKAAAEKAAAIKWPLSDRERGIIESLAKGSK